MGHAQLLKKEKEKRKMRYPQSKRLPMACEQIVLHYAIVHGQSQENRYKYINIYTLVLIIYQLSTRSSIIATKLATSCHTIVSIIHNLYCLWKKSI